MLYVKSSKAEGCTFMGKGIVGHPEMGVIVECRRVVFDEWDTTFSHWKGEDVQKVMYRTDTGYSFDSDMLFEFYEIEQYAPNFRSEKKDAWGIM